MVRNDTSSKSIGKNSSWNKSMVLDPNFIPRIQGPILIYKIRKWQDIAESEIFWPTALKHNYGTSMVPKNVSADVCDWNLYLIL